MDYINMLKPSPKNKDSRKAHNTNPLLPAKRISPPLEGGHNTKIGGMWTIKHEIVSPKFYEILIKT